MSRSTAIVVIGGGLAGASCAASLARRGASVTLLEAERDPGHHASGRSAAMIRQGIAPGAHAALARRGATLIRGRANRFGELFRPVGSLLLGTHTDLSVIAAVEGTPSHFVPVREAIRRAPFLEGRPPLAALWTESDGVVDAGALLTGFLDEAREHGARIVTSARVRAVDGPAPFRVRTEGDEFEASHVVNAAGPWADDVAVLARARPIGLVSRRRHLFHTAPDDRAEPALPFVWDVTRGWYVRPESAGWLLCACDEDDLPPSDIGPSPTSNRLLEKLAVEVPGLGDVAISRCWAGLRTFAPDDQFVLGPDPDVSGFYWAAALGGHGVTVSAAVGERIAASVLDGTQPADGLGPERFAIDRPADGWG